MAFVRSMDGFVLVKQRPLSDNKKRLSCATVGLVIAHCPETMSR